MKKPTSTLKSTIVSKPVSVTDVEATLKQLYRLKTVKRAGWLQAGIHPEQGESVADHSLFVALLALLLCEVESPSLDRNRAILMALVHDLVESVVGDITPESGISPEEKFRREEAAFKSVLKPLPLAKELLSVWQEFETGETAEAQFVRRLDKLEMVFQARIYENTTGLDLDRFSTSVKKLFDQGEISSALYQSLLNKKTAASK